MDTEIILRDVTFPIIFREVGSKANIFKYVYLNSTFIITLGYPITTYYGYICHSWMYLSCPCIPLNVQLTERYRTAEKQTSKLRDLVGRILWKANMRGKRRPRELAVL